MLKKLVFVWLLLVLGSSAVGAQSALPKVETGVFLTIPQTGGALQNKPLGLGGRLTYNVTEHVALDGEVAYFPYNVESFGQSQGLFGVKVGQRFLNQFGLFAKARPGFYRDYVARQTQSHQTFFALDLGGVLEYYPARLVVVRFDLGETWVNYNGATFSYGPGAFPTESHWGVQGSVGVGVRF
jgi:hypothetical protein